MFWNRFSTPDKRKAESDGKDDTERRAYEYFVFNEIMNADEDTDDDEDE